MQSFQYTIVDAVGLHARPAGLLVKEAAAYSSTITIEAEGKSAMARKLFAIMGLGIKAGSVVTVTVEGQDEERACEAMQTFFMKNL